MTEEEDLLARIGELAGGRFTFTSSSADFKAFAGQINRHKNQDNPQQWMNHRFPSSSTHQAGSSYPYGLRATSHGRGRSQMFQNRSLIINSREGCDQPLSASSTPEQIEISSDENSHSTSRGIAKHGRGAKAWMSKDALRQKLERRKQFANNIQATNKDIVDQQVMLSRTGASSQSVNHITVDGIPFRVTDGGKKLLRTTGRLVLRSYRHRRRSDLDRCT